MDDADSIKATISLQAFIADDLGEPARRTAAHWLWRCPLHVDRNPSLVVYADPARGWWCYGCAQGGDIFNWMEKYHKLDFKAALDRLGAGVLGKSPDELHLLAAERRQQAETHRRQAEEKQHQAAQLLAEAREHLLWAELLLDDAEALEFLAAKGIAQATAIYFGLGVCRDYPLGPAISIPWVVDGQLRTIQYRIIGGDTGDRYRWDSRCGAGTIYNADAVPGQGPLLIVEGAIKAMAMVQAGFQVVALTNKNGWRNGWGPKFRHRPVYVALDPDATIEATGVAADIGPTARVVSLPAKPDDLLVRFGWTADDLAWRLNHSRRTGHD